MGSIRYSVTSDNKIKTVHTVVVHRAGVYDIVDPIVHAASPIYEWEHSEAGQYVINNAEETPIWKQHLDITTYRYIFVVVAKLEEKKLSEFYLRFGKIKDL